MDFDTPVLDNHLHLDPEQGQGIEAVKDFARGRDAPARGQQAFVDPRRRRRRA